jgi:sigma-E factor negative regulatory protein RseC
VGVSGEFAWVETQRRAVCDSCTAQHGCGSGTLAKILGHRRVRVRALNHLGAEVGDRVIVSLEDEALVRGSLAVYAVPILWMLGGAALGELILNPSGSTESDLITVVSGLAGLAAGLYWLRRYSAKISRDARYQPSVTAFDKGDSEMAAASVARPVEWFGRDGPR